VFKGSEALGVEECWCTVTLTSTLVGEDQRYIYNVLRRGSGCTLDVGRKSLDKLLEAVVKEDRFFQ